MPKTRSIFRLAIAFLAITLLAACGTPIVAPGRLTIDLGGRAISIVATTGQVGDVVRNVGGERVAVKTLMGAGVDPHLYKPSAGDVIAIQNADVVFYSGLQLEGRMLEIFDRLGRTKPVYAITGNIPRDQLIPSADYPDTFDPHVWFDPTLWATTADVVAERLGALDPQNAAFYRSNAERYKTQILELDTYAREQLNAIPPQSRVLITAHDAFSYFGRRYGIQVRGLQGLSTASEAGGADVQNLAEFIVSRDIGAIFVESSVPQATIQAVQAAVRARGQEVAIGGQLYSDALGDAGTPEGTYAGMFRANIDTISGALAPEA